MIVILCHPDDAGALWLWERLQHLGVGGVELVTVEQLVFSRRIAYRLSGAGDSGSIELADGRVLRPETITGLVNRVQYLPTQHFASADAADREYAAAELSAFLLAWINGVAGRAINPPLPLALGGGTFQVPTVLHHAAAAGLPTRTWRVSASEDGPPEGGPYATLTPEGGPYTVHSVVVFDGRLYGPILPRELQDGCRRLSVLLGAPLLQVVLRQAAKPGWEFVQATGAVDFRIGGNALAAALGRSLARSAVA